MIHERVRATENAQKALAFGLDELEEDELNVFKEHKKVRVFMTGVMALLIALLLLNETLEVAEHLESQFAIDYEALRNEARTLIQKLRGLRDQLSRLLD